MRILGSDKPARQSTSHFRAVHLVYLLQYEALRQSDLSLPFGICVRDAEQEDKGLREKIKGAGWDTPRHDRSLEGTLHSLEIIIEGLLDGYDSHNRDKRRRFRVSIEEIED